MERYTAQTHPSVALVKYWGKHSETKNIPATSSIAVALDRFTTTVTISREGGASAAQMICDGEPTPAALFKKNYQPFLSYCMRIFGIATDGWHIVIDNNYPLAAGFASSSAIYAGLVLVLGAACQSPYSAARLSAMARHGSVSAARALFGGFVALPAQRRRAYRFAPQEHWPELRIVAAQCATTQKPIPSREAMARVRESSPLFRHWRRSSHRWYREACRAIVSRDIERLGRAMQQSYLTMCATMHTAHPPIFYWNERSIWVLKECHRLRARDIVAWETMDAGPQVKILTTARHAERVMDALQVNIPAEQCILSTVGAPPQLSPGLGTRASAAR